MNSTLSSVSGLTLPFLAQALPSAGTGDEWSAAVWVLCGLAALAVAVNQISAAWKSLQGTAGEREIRPQPLEVRPATEFSQRDHVHPGLQTAETCRMLHTRLDERIEGMQKGFDDGITELRLENKADFRGVHARIDQVLGAVSTLSGQITQMNHTGGAR